MKKFKDISLILLLLPLLAMACKSKKAAVEEEATSQNIEIQSNDVHFKFLQTVQYCGGAAPPEDLIKRLATPSPLHKQNLYFVNKMSSEKIYIKHYISSHDTVLSFKPGTYDVYLNSVASLDDYISKAKVRDVKCAKKWFGRKLTTFTLDKDTKEKEIIIHFDCNPCVEPAP